MIGIGGTSEQRQRLSSRLSSSKTLQHQVQGIEGQHTAGGPFASKQADQSTGQLFHLVLTHQPTAGGGATGRSNQGPATRPGTAHLSGAALGEPASEMVEQIAALLIRHRSGFRRWAGNVGGSQQRAAKKGQQKQHPAITGAGNQEAITTGAEVALQHQMGAAADQQPRFRLRLSQQTQLIGRDAGGIDDHARRPALLLTVWPLADRRTELPICALKTNDPAIAHHLQASSRGCEQQQQVQARVVELPIAVANTAVEAAIQPRERALHRLGIEAAGGPKPS